MREEEVRNMAITIDELKDDLVVSEEARDLLELKLQDMTQRAKVAELRLKREGITF